MPTPSSSLTPCEAGAVLMVRNGQSIQTAAAESDLTVPEVRSALERADANRTARPVPAAVAAPTPVRAAAPVPPAPRSKPSNESDLMDTEELLQWGADAGIHRAGMLAERIRTATGELRAMHKRRGLVTEKKAKIAALEAQLAKARGELALISSGKSASKPGAKTPQRNGEAAQIRAWARENGYDVADLGKIAQPIVEAYHRAVVAKAGA